MNCYKYYLHHSLIVIYFVAIHVHFSSRLWQVFIKNVIVYRLNMSFQVFGVFTIDFLSAWCYLANRFAGIHIELKKLMDRRTFSSTHFCENVTNYQEIINYPISLASPLRFVDQPNALLDLSCWITLYAIQLTYSRIYLRSSLQFKEIFKHVLEASLNFNVYL